MLQSAALIPWLAVRASRRCWPTCSEMEPEPDSPDSFVSDTPTAVLIRQILGAVAQFDKATLVHKLRGARDRKSAKLGRRIEGNPNWKPAPEAHVTVAKAAHARGLSLRAISTELASKGLLSHSGKPYGPQSVKVMLR